MNLLAAKVLRSALVKGWLAAFALVLLLAKILRDDPYAGALEAILCVAVGFGCVCGARALTETESADNTVGLEWWDWYKRAGLGCLFAVSFAIGTAFLLWYLDEDVPDRVLRAFRPLVPSHIDPEAIFLRGRRTSTSDLWFRILPLIALEACIWGLLASALLRRSLAASIVAIGCIALVWAVLGIVPGWFALSVRFQAMVLAAAFSFAQFVYFSKQRRLTDDIRAE